MNALDESLMLKREDVASIWDAIVIGAGPAGSLVARKLALEGLRTLLLDAKRFPREKVCGGYLNSRALGALRDAGLDHIVGRDQESKVAELEILDGRRRTRFQLPPGRVICRKMFDEALLRAAESAGAKVWTGVTATVAPAMSGTSRAVIIHCDGQQETLTSRIVICADGLSRSSVRNMPEFSSCVATNSRVGIGAMIRGGRDFDVCPAGQLTMLLSHAGYVGISRAGDGCFNIAAAVDRNALLHAAPGRIVAKIFARAGIDCGSAFANANWRGTPPLTSRPKHVAADRVFLVGDSGGYIEPFTGEGMAFAFEGASAVAPLAIEAVGAWNAQLAGEWEALHREIVSKRQRTCQQLAWILRRRWAAYVTIGVCRVLPRVAESLIERTTVTTNRIASKHYRPARKGTL